MKPLLEIVKLNQTRYGTDFNGGTAVAKLKEELQELQDAIEINNITEIVDALSDIIVIATGELTKLKYNPELVLKQTVKEISSRQQDPEQAKAWAAGNKQPGEKWNKDKSQDPSTLYTADYSTCKFK